MSTKNAFGRISRVSQLRRDPALLAAKNFFYVADSCSSRRGYEEEGATGEEEGEECEEEDLLGAEVQRAALRAIGWQPWYLPNPATISDTDELLPAGSLLLAGPQLLARMQQQLALRRLANRIVYCERAQRHLSCSWLLYRLLVEQQVWQQRAMAMGLLHNNQCVLAGCFDFVRPVLLLDAAGDSELAAFLRMHVTGVVMETLGGDSTSWQFIPSDDAAADSPRNEQLLKEFKNFKAKCLAAVSARCLLRQLLTASCLRLNSATVQIRTFLLVAPRTCYSDGIAAFFHSGVVHTEQCAAGAGLARSGQRSDSTHEYGWSVRQLCQHALEHKLVADENWADEILLAKLQAASVYLLLAAGHLLQDCRSRRFYLLQLHFQLDEQLQPWLLRVQQSCHSHPAPSPRRLLLLVPKLHEEAALIVAELLAKSATHPKFKARHLLSPRLTNLVFDSADPSVQRELMQNFPSGEKPES